MTSNTLSNLTKKPTTDERKLNAFELRKKIGIDTSISGKRLVDLSKEGK